MCDGRKLRVKGSIDAKDSVRDAASLGKCGEMAILTSSLDLYSRQGASDSRPRSVIYLDMGKGKS